MAFKESTPQLAPQDKPDMSAEAPFSAALQRPGRSGSQDGEGAVSRRQLPQAIAHRGYKMAYPENSMAAFCSAVEIGAHAIETDLHLSKDGVVVLSHDGTLKRCFGEDRKVSDCDWSYLSTLRTTRKPHEPMPRLVDLLEYLAQPGQENIWVLLDIKLLAVPKMNFNMFMYSMVGPSGTKFMRAAREAARSVFVWTVNDDDWMRWSIRKGVDGVITDNPERFLQICKEWPDDEDAEAAGRRQMRHFLNLRRPKPLVFLLLFRVLAMSVALVALVKAGTPRQRVQKALRSP
ncbi:Glycerophosphoryl diester phosphodiesterase [Apiospora aurea]|uniref:Glycerophosphoryl diester phosphodiesterase n=1 Tax=Apiospora aurea TaxID=335848 RepID=A0ABR1QC82_9PEZI